MRRAAAARPAAVAHRPSPQSLSLTSPRYPECQPALGHVCPGYCGPWTRAAPIPLGLRPPAGLTLLPIFLCPPSPASGFSFFLVCCSLPSLYQQDAHCPPALPLPVHTLPLPLPSAKACGGKGGKGRVAGGYLNDPEGGHSRGSPSRNHSQRMGLKGSHVCTHNTGRHSLKLTYIYLCTTYAHTILMHSCRPARPTYVCAPPHSSTHM